MIIRLVAAAIAVLTAATASAGIQSLSGGVQQIALPFSVQENAVENNVAAGIFAEQQGVILAAPLAVNISTSGVFDEAADLTPANIPAGTKINSYFIHADTNNQAVLSGKIVFDEPVLGIVFGTSESQASHAVLGLSSVTYPATGSSDANRAALELKVNEEQFQLNKSTRTVDFVVVRDILFTSSIYDNFRVITDASAVPEPAGIVTALIGLVAVALRRRR